MTEKRQPTPKPFYELPKQQRLELANRAASETRTMIERWSVLTTPEAAGWNQRAAYAAAMLAGQASVADIGCGDMQLERHHATGCRYVPVDVVRRDVRTVVVDLNKQLLPTGLDGSAYAVLGLLEYIYDVAAFLNQLSGTLVVSYNPVEGQEHDRMEHGWVNAFSIAESEQMTLRLGWITLQRTCLDRQWLWKLQRPATPSLAA